MGFLDRFLRKPEGPMSPQSLPIEAKAPEFKGLAGWINSEPLTLAGLAGKVVLLDFWTYSCINCIRTLPYVKGWHDAYKDRGLAIIGVHTPEFDFEKDRANVEAAVRKFGIAYPVALDNDYAMWNAYRNHYWPAHYFIDAQGNIRYQHFGEGGYDHSEAVINALLEEAGAARDGRDVSKKIDTDIDFGKIGTPETYLGFARIEYLGSPESVRKDAAQRYSAVRDPAKNIFYFDGAWEIRDEYATPKEAGAAVIYRISASKAHLVMDGGGAAARVRVTLDGKPLSDGNRGADASISAGESIVTARDGRMYDLVDLHGSYGTHLLRLEFLDPGVKCYAFTFG